MQNEKEIIDVLTLIETLLDFISMVPDHDDWNYETLKFNPPRLIRLQQIDSLLRIYAAETYYANDIRTSIENTLSGQFILCRPDVTYSDLFKYMLTAVQAYHPNYGNVDTMSIKSLQYNFEQVFKYVIELNRITKFNSGKLLLCHEHYYSYILTQQVNNSIDIDQLILFLGSVMNPIRIAYTKKILVDEFQYVDIDLNEIDLKWL